MAKYKLGFIGTGNMGTALIKAVKQAGLAKSMIASDKNIENLNHIKGLAKTTTDNKEVVEKSDIVFLCVKPFDIEDVLKHIKSAVKKQIIVSIAAGIRIKTIEDVLKNKKVVRVMPNAPCMVGEMAAGFSLGSKASQDDAIIVEEILSSAGKAFLLKEELLDAVTGLSGSGPAFIAYLIEALIEGGIKSGLNRDVATELALQTAFGTVKLLKEKGMSPKELINMVSSPGGTTLAGREILEKSDVNQILIETIKRATERSKELGKNV